ncbi:hypothetical protein BCIN_09g04980 [Botrytis cinerea B05.10]|uniref:High osmolarity sensitivity protein 3 n=1 Tax=Botryotinia fuckeliana (strain B05.10) TaxID=332648 RepID=A0A384JT07_BOTFB|nr:hypothetical protein BCIN_09g04980 [Botrytis cinerea B05.10]ATZ53709.1 hypothetical protein BCIN_09g04980 [Botrytis cinerea B05.10]
MSSRLPSGGAPRLSTAPSSSTKPRQLSHLHAQLAQLSANLGDLENLLRNTSIQAESIRGLGAFHGGLFMAASKVLGEETIAGSAQQQQQQGQGQTKGHGNRASERKDDSDSDF